MHLEGRESWAKKIPSYPTSTMIFKLMNVYIMSLGNVFSSVYFMMWVQVRIFARKPAIAAGQGDYALNITGPILKFFEKYYSSKYPLPKSGKSTTRIWFKDKYRPTFANCPESSCVHKHYLCEIKVYLESFSRLALIGHIQLS